ncbi:MAG TPA: hypothetical protein VEI97_01045, partial [bacterium]|nr:hypothetical protein [bacterium]
MTKKTVGTLIAQIHKYFGSALTVETLDRMKDEAFLMATKAGMTVSISDILIPEEKATILADVDAEVESIHAEQEQRIKDLIKKHPEFTAAQIRQMYENLDHRVLRRHEVKETLERTKNPAERELRLNLYDLKCDTYDRIINANSLATNKVTKAMMDNYEQNYPTNNVYMMANSGARGNVQQVRQLGALRGLMADPTGHVIEILTPRNLKEGLTVLQYFLSTHGARKGLADTALRTADSGYLTRRLVDVAQDVTIIEQDCGSEEFVELSATRLGRRVIQSLGDRILGRVAAEDILDPDTGEAIVIKNREITEEDVEKIGRLNLESMKVRSVLTCMSKRGICQRCYGRDLGTGKMVELGTPAGIIAAQSIGEPGT